MNSEGSKQTRQQETREECVEEKQPGTRQKVGEKNSKETGKGIKELGKKYANNQQGSSQETKQRKAKRTRLQTAQVGQIATTKGST